MRRKRVTARKKHHRAENLNVTGTAEEAKNPADKPARKRVKWSPMNDKRAWKEFEEMTDLLLKTKRAGTISRKSKSLTTVKYTTGKRDSEKEHQTRVKALRKQ